MHLPGWQVVNWDPGRGHVTSRIHVITVTGNHNTPVSALPLKCCDPQLEGANNFRVCWPLGKYSLKMISSASCSSDWSFTNENWAHLHSEGLFGVHSGLTSYEKILELKFTWTGFCQSWFWVISKVLMIFTSDCFLLRSGKCSVSRASLMIAVLPVQSTASRTLPLWLP